MSFVTPLLLAGAALVAVPIVLHLIMRREAQQLKFPALRFVQQRRSLNQHRLRLRHLLLLALRCAVIALLAFAMARPILRGSSAAGKENAPVATALVFDNSLRMQYEQANESRLAVAKRLALWVLEQIPDDSPVTVVDRGGRQRGQEMDRMAAELRVERLDSSTTARPMEDTLLDALRWLEEKPDYRGEVYVFTDMSAEAWPADTSAEIGKRLEELPGTNVYLIDVGARAPRNVRLGGLRLSSDRLAPGGLLRLDTELSWTGDSQERDEVVVELFLNNPSGSAEKRGQQVIAFARPANGGSDATGEPAGGQSAAVEFSLSGLELGTHQGFVRIAANDPLAADDVRYFTAEVRPPTKILLVGETADDTIFLREALAPTTTGGLVQSMFACDVAEFDQLEQMTLADYAAICLLDPPPLVDATWRSLADFAERGGGVGIFLGRRARREEMNQPAPQKLLPARLRWQSREATYLRTVAVEHPVLSELRELGGAVPWSEFPVFKYWELEVGNESTHVVAAYANGKPALVERPIGSGRVLMMTTPVSDPAHDAPWNVLPTGPDPWPFLALANGVARHLAGAIEPQLNYVAGQTVVLPLAPSEQVTSYVLQIPDGTAMRQLHPADEDGISIAATETLGNYRVRAGGKQDRLDRGFSVNLPAELTRLERIGAKELVAALGTDRTRIARTREEIEVRVGQARTGRELFPFVILLVALLLAGEQWLANRFYDGSSAAGSPLSTRKASSEPILPKADSRQPTASAAT